MMDAASAIMSTATMMGNATVCNTRKRKRSVYYIAGLNSFGGLKVQNNVTSLGLPLCTEQSFAKVVSSLKGKARGGGGGGGGGGAASSTCNAAGEIFQIAAIMNGLVLLGVAVGFVLLRIETSLEEAAELQ